MGDAGAAEVDEGDEGVGGVEAEAAVADQADAAVEAFQAPVGEAEADCGEDAGAMTADGLGELDERRQPGSGGPGQPGVEVRRRDRRVIEVVEQPQLFFEQERAVERPVGVLDLAELGELVDCLLLGGISAVTSGCP